MILAILTGCYLALLLVRFGLAIRFLERERRAPDPPLRSHEVTVLQPILGGDPALESCLRANAEAHPGVRFLWLVDEDDPAGQAAARRAQAANVDIAIGPPPRDGENPKTAKLADALHRVETTYLAILDDDTVLPRGALDRALAALGSSGGIAFGLPVYAPPGGMWSGLVAAFVNGASLITYPVAAETGAGRTLNGMFYVVETGGLRALGGFDAIRGELTDDYAMARLYTGAGRPLIQTAIVHPVTTTVASRGAYFRLIRRWMIFANRYVGENAGLFTLGLIGVSTFAPLMLALPCVALGEWPALAALFAILGLKAGAMAWLRAHYGGRRASLAGAVLEIAADLLTPLHWLSALIRPSHMTWRTRTMRVGGGGIAYD